MWAFRVMKKLEVKKDTFLYIQATYNNRSLDNGAPKWLFQDSVANVSTNVTD